MVAAKRKVDDSTMIRRFVVLALWTYFAWYLGAMLATFTGGPAIAGPIAGVLTAAVGTYGWLRAARRRPAMPTTFEASPTR
jgi:hypothetical protein